MRYLAPLTLTLALSFLALAEPAWAEEAAKSEFRYWWDFAWRILNFAILAFALYKVAKEPLKEFLLKERQRIHTDIQAMEKAKAEALAETQEIEAKTATLAAQLKEYEENLTLLADRERARMAEEAEKETELILERASLWSVQAAKAARQELADEMLEVALEIAREKVAEAINADDRARMLDQFTDQVASQAAPHTA